MPQFTKNAISDAFFSIAARKAPEKITVKDIVEECGVTRNTFYYYFRDVYDVIEDAFLTVASAPQAEAGQSLSERERIHFVFHGIARFLQKNRGAMRNICSSIGYDTVESYLSRAVHPVLADAVNAAAANRNVQAKDRQLIADLLRESILGVLLDWLREDASETPEELLHRISVLYDGVLEHMLQNLLG